MYDKWLRLRKVGSCILITFEKDGCSRPAWMSRREETSEICAYYDFVPGKDMLTVIYPLFLCPSFPFVRRLADTRFFLFCRFGAILSVGVRIVFRFYDSVMFGYRSKDGDNDMWDKFCCFGSV